MASWEDDATLKLRGYFKTDAATGIVVAMLGALRTVQRIQRGLTDDDTPRDVLRLLFTTVIAIYDSPFIQQHGAKLLPIYQAAVMGWLDGARYLSEVGKQPEDAPRDEKTIRLVENAQACARLYREFVVQAMVCEVGPQEGIGRSLRLRETLDELMER
jgi:hypothetical protein